MKVRRNDPPRTFAPDPAMPIVISDCGDIELQPDELVTFTQESGSAYDVGRKSWGYYATPSLNSRLPASGLRPALMCNSIKRYYVVLVEVAREAEFRTYLEETAQELVAWLDDDATLDRLADASLKGNDA